MNFPLSRLIARGELWEDAMKRRDVPRWNTWFAMTCGALSVLLFEGGAMGGGGFPSYSISAAAGRTGKERSDPLTLEEEEEEMGEDESDEELITSL